ncbi:hypothetical protein AXF42_Ash004530 [Apostasia shenzhenica]|uniref:Uncharacterized protein n=1 Tax=Apostasia shenzhenica TaxID=1088818 RepID=A0A2I0BGX3_9ASPA|nr:hypothetical protein AXF42_Ash004530 [Apostasia shenzhenica]
MVHKYPSAVYFKVKSMEEAEEKFALYRKLITKQTDCTEIPNQVVNDISNPLHRKPKFTLAFLVGFIAEVRYQAKLTEKNA